MSHFAEWRSPTNATTNMKTEIKKPAQAGKTKFTIVHVETRIYRNPSSRVYYERPFVNGRRTWRSLLTQNLKFAREELHRRRAGVSYSLLVKSEPAPVTVGEIIRRYQKDDYPDRQKHPRQGRTLESETRNCSVLLKFWDYFAADKVSLVECDRYHDWRKRRIARGIGDRAVDMEMSTLNNAILWSLRRGLIRQNPLNFRRPRYCSAKNVRHCREFMPHNTEDLHEIAAILFSDIRSETLGWQMLFEAFTGLRTCEALQLRTNAKPFEPGWITADGKSLCVRRAKNQESVNPFVQIHDGLAAWLKGHNEWKQRRYPNSPWFFPNYRESDNKHADKCALGHALYFRREKIGKKITAHAMRAFYVTVRRSHGTPDIQIAYEIGHTSGGTTLASVYGGVPPHWLTDDGPKLKWLPDGKSPAWESIGERHPQNPLPPDPTELPATFLRT